MTTRRFFLSAGLSALLLSVHLLTARAEDSGTSSLPICCCAYAMWTCTYEDGSYWSGCDTKWESSQVFTWVAEGRCQIFHPA